MPAGQKDYNAKLLADSTVGVIDAGEWQSRINRGLASESRSGRILWMTDFSQGLNEVVSTSGGTGSGVSLVSVSQYYGQQNLNMFGQNTIGDFAQIQKILPLSNPHPIQANVNGFECLFAQAIGLSFAFQFDIVLTMQDTFNNIGFNAHLAFVGNGVNSIKLNYYFEGQPFLIADVTKYFTQPNYSYNWIKFTVGSDKKFRKIYFNDLAIYASNLNAQDGQFEPVSNALQMLLKTNSITAKTTVFQIQSIVLTDNEP